MKFAKILVLVATFGFAMPTWAADAAPAAAASQDMSKMPMSPPSKEAREKMAAAHTEMAACLRSDKDMKQCHDALHKECQSTMGESCAGMGMQHGMRKGMKQKK